MHLYMSLSQYVKPACKFMLEVYKSVEKDSGMDREGRLTLQDFTRYKDCVMNYASLRQVNRN